MAGAAMLREVAVWSALIAVALVFAAAMAILVTFVPAAAGIDQGHSGPMPTVPDNPRPYKPGT